MKLFEVLKKPFLKNNNVINPSIPINKIQTDLTNNDYLNITGYYDSNNDFLNNQINSNIDRVTNQANKINLYRNVATNPDVADAIDEVVNEVSYALDLKNIIDCSSNSENTKLDKVISDEFKKIYRVMNLENTFWSLFRQTYIDGQVNIHITYNKNGSIKSLKVLDPRYLYYDKHEDVFKYLEEAAHFNLFPSTYGIEYEKIETIDDKKFAIFNRDEVVHWNFGLFDNTGLVLSYLDKAIKTSNQLKTLEDLLIPLRFSRSVSRRVFNIDIADMPNSKAESFMRKVQDQFKYKKYYNAETGEVSNQQHIVSMVEDYWFANRSGSRGTQVETLDETGNLGEIADILYFQKKLYKALGVPTNRLNSDESNFNYEDTQTLREEYKFYQFINRLRRDFCGLLYELLRRSLVSQKILKESEFEIHKNNIDIYFSTENPFLEEMKLKNFLRKTEAYSSVREFSGNIYSVNKVFSEIFKWNKEEIEENLKEIEEESKNPLYKNFYKKDEEEKSDW